VDTAPSSGAASDCLPIRNAGLDVIRIYNNTLRDGIGYNLSYSGKDFTEVLPPPSTKKIHVRPVRLRLSTGFAAARRRFFHGSQGPLP
jgi:hypothetical protein